MRVLVGAPEAENLFPAREVADMHDIFAIIFVADLSMPGDLETQVVEGDVPKGKIGAAEALEAGHAESEPGVLDVSERH